MKVAPRTGSFALSGGLLLLAVYAVLAGCDATAVLSVDEVKWDQVYVLSAVPMKLGMEAGSSAYSPMCRSVAESPDGVLFNLLFQGTQKKDPLSGGGQDHDMSIKPGDFVDNKFIEEALVTTNMLELNLACMEPYPDDDAYSCGGSLGGPLPPQSLNFFSYHKPAAENAGNTALAILIDMSGSMIGLVEPSPPYAEDNYDKISQNMAGVDRTAIASDPGGARFAAVDSLIRNMNDDDPVVVFAFSEHMFEMVCELKAQPDADLATKLKECFGSKHSMIVGEKGGFSPLDSIRSEEKGRTPLWYAVNFVYRYLEGDASVWPHEEGKAPAIPSSLENADYRHIVVIGDGPDTCGPSTDLSACSDVCLSYTGSYENVRTLIESRPFDERIPVHFVQMAAKGYLERDPRQQEIACLTDGQYVFINTMDHNGTVIPKANLADVLNKTLLRIRYTFRGYWRVAVNLSTMSKDNEPSAGFVYALQGTGKILPGKTGLLVSKESLFAFKVGTTDMEGVEEFVDRRVSVRKECDPTAGGRDGEEPCPADMSLEQCKDVDTPEKLEACGKTKGELWCRTLRQLCKEDRLTECVTAQWYCDEQSLTCKNALSWKKSGEEVGCVPQTVKIKVEVETKTAAGTETDTKTVDSSNVRTLCCLGRCRPPKPPVVPDEVRHPEGMVQACFFYDEGRGWVHEDPDDMNSPWVYWATLNVDAAVGCTWENLAPHLKYASIGEKAYPADWDCNGTNCYPPPGEGEVEPPPEEPAPEEPAPEEPAPEEPTE